MGRGFKETEGREMKCITCGSEMVKVETDLPFKIGSSSIVIIKGLPVFQCSKCSEYSIEDPTMAKVEKMLNVVDESTELEVLRFAA
jgi:YgiT-type zinc finger domain-containing protein